MAMLTEEDSFTSGPSTSSAHAMTAKPVAGDDETSEPAKKIKVFWQFFSRNHRNSEVSLCAVLLKRRSRVT